MDDLPPVTFGLVQPSEPGNVGAAARSLAAFGFERLLLIDPVPRQVSRDRALAVRMGRAVLDAARTVRPHEVPELLEGFDEIWGTSARTGRRRVQAPAPELVASYLKRDGCRLLVLFGPERDGLNLEWLDRCHRLIRLPTPGGPLNLAQAVTVMAYELRSQHDALQATCGPHSICGAASSQSAINREEPQATLGVRRAILEHIDRILAEIGYPTRSLRGHPYQAHLEPLRSGPLPRRHARWLMGLLTRLVERLKGAPPGDDAPL